MIIPEEVIAEIHEQAKIEAPNEACGYLRGIDGKVHGRIALANADASPEHFSFTPSDQFAALKASRELGEELVAVYHSHPETPARMSEEDIRLANDPDMIFVIHSLADGATKAFRVDREKTVHNVEVEIASAAKG